MANFQFASVAGTPGATGWLLPADNPGALNSPGRIGAGSGTVADLKNAQDMAIPARLQYVASYGNYLGLSATSFPGAVPLTDGIPSDDVVPGAPAGTKVGYNVWGPQPVTGRSAVDQFNAGGPVSIEVASQWWNGGGSAGGTVGGGGGVSGQGTQTGGVQGTSRPYVSDGTGPVGSHTNPFDLDRAEQGNDAYAKSIPPWPTDGSNAGNKAPLWQYVGDNKGAYGPMGALLSWQGGGTGQIDRFQLSTGDYVQSTRDLSTDWGYKGGTLTDPNTSRSPNVQTREPVFVRSLLGESTGTGGTVNAPGVTVTTGPTAGGLFGGMDMGSLFQMIIMLKLLSAL